MTHADKLAAINAAFNDLVALQRYLVANGHAEQLQVSEAHTLRSIAKIMGYSIEAARQPLTASRSVGLKRQRRLQL